MRYLKKLIVLTVTCILLFSLPIHVSAAVEPGTDDPNATGLITSYSFSCTAGNKRVLIIALQAAISCTALCTITDDDTHNPLCIVPILRGACKKRASS